MLRHHPIVPVVPNRQDQAWGVQRLNMEDGVKMVQIENNHLVASIEGSWVTVIFSLNLLKEVEVAR